VVPLKKGNNCPDLNLVSMNGKKLEIKTLCLMITERIDGCNLKFIKNI